MRNRRTRSAAVLAAAAVALAACGQGGGTGGGSSQGDGQSDSQGDKVIQIWHTESTPATVAALDEIIETFLEDHPDYTVVQESVAWGDLQVKFQAALAAGDLPELTHVEPMFVKTLYEQGLLRDLDEVVESMEGDYYRFLADMFEQEDGKAYGVTHAWGVDLTTYRKDMYGAAGVDPTTVSTWDEFREQLIAVRDANPGVSPLMLAGSVAHNVNEEVQMWLGSNGGSLFDDEGAPTLNTPQMREVLEFWRSLREDRLLDSSWTSAGYADTLSSLAQGNSATIFSFGRATYTFAEQAPELVENDGIGVVGTKPVGPSGDDWITQLDAEPWVAFKDAGDSDAAVEFLKVFYEPENYLKWVGSVPTQLLPVRPSFFEADDYLALPELETWGFWIETQREVAETGKALPLMITKPSDMELPYVSDLYGSGILLDLAMQVVEQGEDIDAAMANAQKRAEELLSGRY